MSQDILTCFKYNAFVAMKSTSFGSVVKINLSCKNEHLCMLAMEVPLITLIGLMENQTIQEMKLVGEIQYTLNDFF